ncbi:hypothetical protein VNI00_003116 [Paramarasmius palmivorus]|uniref:Uncharacterized protein n=1 Tax=Paramarasmius palmivorus TaxID=297713 RepID=A0AAW0DT84_9AGAR
MFRRHLSPKQAVMLVEFDKLKRTLDWNVPKTGGGVNDYMELLVKETVTLHKVLSRYLSSTVVEVRDFLSEESFGLLLETPTKESVHLSLTPLFLFFLIEQDVMSQVFAAINHRLSEEYSQVELPHAEAKMRLLADAKYLHSKLSGLKNVGGLNNMLEIVIQEKRLPQAQVKNAPLTPTRSTTSPPPINAINSTSTSQRLKGLLSGRSTSASFDKPQPPPPPPQATPTPPTSRPQTPQRQLSDASPRVPGKDVANGVITGIVNGTGANANSKANGDTTPLPPLPPEASADGSDRSGFRQVEASELEAETEPPMSGPERRDSQDKQSGESQKHDTSTATPVASA